MSRKIGFYCSSMSWGGLEMNFIRYAKWLQEVNFDVVVFCVNNSKILEKAIELRIPYVVIKRNKKNFDWKNAKILKKHLIKLKIDTVWVRDRRDINIFALLKRKKGTRHIKLVYQQAMQFAKKKKDIFHTRNYKQVDYWIAPLQFLKEEVIQKTRFLKEKIHVIPLASDIDTKKASISKKTALDTLNLPEEKTIIGVIGRLDPLKGQLFLVKALAQIKDEFPELDLLIVGEKTYNEHDDYLKELNTTIKNEELSNRVHLRPFMKDIRYFFASVDRFIMASKAETIGMVTIESMSYGTPVIGTNSGGTPELLEFGKLGSLYTVNDQADFIQRLKDSLKNSEQVKETARRAKEIALKKYSKSEVVKAIVELLS